jgi:sugar lactone lactonase YvrE
MAINIRCLDPDPCLLGEGPVWDEVLGDLYWVDIKTPAIRRYRPATGEAWLWPVPETIGSLVLRGRGGLLLALKSGFAFFDPSTQKIEPLFDPEPDRPENRLNDGKCDPLGRFWVGSMHDPEQKPTGHLYRLGPDLAVEGFEMGFVVTNGPCWSGDGDVFYFADSGNRRIHAFDFDLTAGRPGARRLFAQVAPDAGHPDGMCVDAEDHVWSAHWDGGRLTRYRPDGVVAGVIQIPAARVTSCCFGGPGLDILYVTTARIGLTPAELAAAPDSGRVFEVTGLGIKGRPAARFAG